MEPIKRKHVSTWSVILGSLVFAIIYLAIRGCEGYNLSQYGKYTKGRVVSLWNMSTAVVLYEVDDKAYYGKLELPYYSSINEGDTVVVQYYPRYAAHLRGQDCKR